MLIGIVLSLVALFAGFVLYSVYSAKKQKGQRLADTAVAGKVQIPAAARWYLVFTTRTCSACKVLKQHLESQGLPFIEFSIEDDIETARQLHIWGTPTTWCMDGDLIADVKSGIFKP